MSDVPRFSDWQLMRACNPHFNLIIEECAQLVDSFAKLHKRVPAFRYAAAAIRALSADDNVMPFDRAAIIEECALALLSQDHKRWQQGDSEGAKHAQEELANAIRALKDKP